MSGLKVEVAWSPHDPNRFITIGGDIQLYEIEELKECPAKPLDIQISDTLVANLVATNSDFPYLKCAAWYPKRQHHQLLALGLANGKAVLSSFEDTDDDLAEFAGREFTPKHSRPCNCISWNPSDSRLLACGLEKNRADHGILIWDVTRPAYTPTEIVPTFDKRHVLGSSYPVDAANIARPALELGLSESVQSLHWFHHSQHLFVCGMNNKHIKIFDLRDPSKHQNSTPTKAVYNVSVDPFFEHRLASVFENLFVLWDIRNFEKPVVTTHEQRQILKLSWCPTRWCFLAALVKDSNEIKLYNIQSSSSDEIEPTVLERRLQPLDKTVSSFAWHPAQENRMLVVGHDNRMTDFTVYDQIALCVSPLSELVWTCGRNTLLLTDVSGGDHFYAEDISSIMVRRAKNGYGLKMQQIWQNSFLCEDPALYGVWMWLDLVKAQRQEKKSYFKNSMKYEGVHTIVCGENSAATISNSESREMSLVGVNSSGFRRTRYVSEERERALQLCGWGSEADTISFFKFLERLEKEGHYTRAASICVFNLNVQKAIEILSKGAASEKESGMTDLNAIAMALAGYTDDKTGLWQKISSDLKSRLTDPHLRAMFTFLIDDTDNYDEIMEETDIAVQDKLALALIYYPDVKLANFLNTLKQQMIEDANLDGILLTGLTRDGIVLIQNYVDATCDVQTASLIILHTLPSQASQAKLPKVWVQGYRDLLDIWRLWKQRALFDVMWYKSSSAEKRPAQQIFVTCTFCRQSVSNYFANSLTPANPSRFSQLPATSVLKTKVTCCPTCRKPLPRCSLCLGRMGTPAGLHWKKPIIGKPEKKLTPFSNWLTWCQTCRHGGHSMHILSWFCEHTECTITGCSCKCMSLDGAAKLNSVTDVSS